MQPRAIDAALTRLIDDRGEVLVRYAYLLTGDVPAAQDLVQDALVKVFARTRGGFEPDTLEAYVRRTIATLYIDRHRRGRRWAEVRHLVVAPDVGASHDHSTSDALDLRAALATLGRQERTAVVLRFFEDLTVRDVAEVMGLAEGSVKRYLSNAMRRLEERLGPVAATADDDVVLTTTQRNARKG